MSNMKILESKKTIVANIKEKFEKAQTVVLVDYRGLTVAEDTELRNQLRQAGVEYAVLNGNAVYLTSDDKRIFVKHSAKIKAGKRKIDVGGKSAAKITDTYQYSFQFFIESQNFTDFIMKK